MKIYHSLALLLICVSLCGCSNNQRLTGKVTFSDDGSPLTVGLVCFENTENKTIARGNITADGAYTVGFESDKNGIPKGTYRVFITGAVLDKGFDPKTMAQILEPQTDAKHCSPDTSGLTFTADGKTKTFDITVDRFKGKK